MYTKYDFNSLYGSFLSVHHKNNEVKVMESENNHVNKANENSYTFGVASKDAINRQEIASELGFNTPLAVIDIDEYVDKKTAIVEYDFDGATINDEEVEKVVKYYYKDSIKKFEIKSYKVVGSVANIKVLEYGIRYWKIPVVAEEVYNKANAICLGEELYTIINISETSDPTMYKNISELRKLIKKIVNTPWPTQSKSKEAKVTIFGV